jgi:hypothetical protein
VDKDWFSSIHGIFLSIGTAWNVDKDLTVACRRVVSERSDCEHDDKVREREQKQDIKYPVLSTQLPVIEKQLEDQSAKPEDGQKAA